MSNTSKITDEMKDRLKANLDKATRDLFPDMPNNPPEPGKQEALPLYASHVIEAIRREDGLYIVRTLKGVTTLSDVLLTLELNRGTFKPLGIFFEPGLGRNVTICAVYISFPIGAPIAEYFIEDPASVKLPGQQEKPPE